MKASSIAETVVSRLRDCLPAQDGPIALHEPEIGQRERDLVDDCLASGWVSSGGPYVAKFEDALTQITGAEHAVACVNATAALSLAMRLVGVRPGDEVLMPSLTFVATANAARHLGATPHFVDIERTSLGLDPSALEDYLRRVIEPGEEGCVNRGTGRRIGALVAVHVFGHPAAIVGLVDVADSFGLPFVEDAAEALGSFHRGRACGTFGRAGVLSFNGNKIVTTGGGGAILTGDDELAGRARHLSTTAKLPHPWEYRHDEVGYNFRLPGLNAALGCAQLERLPDFLSRKRRLAETYQNAFADVDDVRVRTEPPEATSNYWLNVLQLADPETSSAVLDLTHRAGFQTRPVWTPLHRLPMYGDVPHAPLKVTDELAGRLVCLPSSARLA